MGLDSIVKKMLREKAKGAFSYYRSLSEFYDKAALDATVVDVNVELFKKPGKALNGHTDVCFASTNFPCVN